jgi:hypothetical protein
MEDYFQIYTSEKSGPESDRQHPATRERLETVGARDPGTDQPKTPEPASTPVSNRTPHLSLRRAVAR